MKKRYLTAHPVIWAVALAAGTLALPSWADAPLAQGGAITISAQDVEADVQQRVPESARGQVLAQPTAIAQIAANLYARRAMAGLADAAGMRADAAVLAALNVARDRVLSDAWLAKIDAAATPSADVLERLARDRYRADPKRFVAPERRQLRHILIAGNEPESRAQAEKLLEELRAGANFEEVAKERSADVRSGAKGGDLGFVERGRMVPEFEAAAYALDKPMALSEVVQTRFGYHVIQLVAIEPEALRPFDDVRARLEADVLSTLRQEARAAEAQRLQQAMTANPEAVADFVAKQPPIEVK